MAEARLPRIASREAALGLALGATGAAAALATDWRIPALLAGALALTVAAAWTLARPYRWFAAFCVLALLAPPLPFELGSTGPHLAVLAAVIGVCGLLGRNPSPYLPSSSTGLPLLAYATVLALSAGPALWISGPEAAAGSLARTALFAIAVLAYLALRHGAAEIDSARWMRGLLILGFLTALIGCVDFILQLEPVAGYGIQMVWLPEGIVRRAQGVFYDANQFGNVCAFFLIGIAAAALRRGADRPLSGPALALMAVVLLAALVFSFSRGAMLAAVAGLLVLGVLERRSLAQQPGAFTGALIVLFTSGLVAFLASAEFTSTYAMRFLYTAWRAVADPAEALDVRLESWSRVLEMLAEHPMRLLLGVGYKTLASGAGADAPLIVDNQWLAALGETGLLGVVALAALLVGILRGSWRAALSANPAAALLGVWSLCFWIGQFVQMLFVDLMTYWRVLPVYLAVLALAEREAERRAG
jgi:O-antigen ligase